MRRTKQIEFVLQRGDVGFGMLMHDRSDEFRPLPAAKHTTVNKRKFP